MQAACQALLLVLVPQLVVFDLRDGGTWITPVDAAFWSSFARLNKLTVGNPNYTPRHIARTRIGLGSRQQLTKIRAGDQHATQTMNLSRPDDSNATDMRDVKRARQTQQVTHNEVLKIATQIGLCKPLFTVFPVP